VHTIFDDYTFSCFRDISGSPKLKVGHMTLTTPLLRVICPTYVATWYSPPVYNIWWP